ncbi:MAG: DUF4435 domain-containing protein [Bacilli bacterium]|nr:DUF4435 domain-containing protein [Bacilli bacterium]
MSNFYDQFNNARNNQPNSKMLMEFNQKRNYIDTDNNVCFVEGPDDKRFYRFIKGNDKLHSIHKSDYIYSNKNSNESHGKRGVLLMYNYLYNKFSSYLDKCIFIVDHDYNGLVGYGVSNEKGITVTKNYAFENYFLEDSNIDKIFNYFNISNDIDNFKKILKKYIIDVGDFVRVKSTLTNNKQVHVSSIFSNNEIFTFNFNNSNIFNTNYMEKEITNMFDAIKKNSKAYDFYLVKAKDYMHSYRWIRGHDIYNFLYEYLKQIHNKDINNDDTYREIVKLLDVNINVRDGLGNILK